MLWSIGQFRWRLICWWLVMSDYELESLDEGWGGLAFGSLGLVFLVYSMRSHIHAWNMAWGLLVEIKIWFNPIYGQVVRGSSRLGCILHLLIISLFLSCIMCKFPCYYVIIMVDILSLLNCWLYVGNKHGLWQTWIMVLIIFWLVNEWIMNVWPIRW